MISCRYRFSDIGWIRIRSEYDAVVCEGMSLFAFSFDSPDFEVQYYLGEVEDVADAGEAGKASEISGEISEEKYVSGGKAFRMKEGQMMSHHMALRCTDEATSIVYRVHLAKTGWTDYYHDGELCGESADIENYISGVQVFSCRKDQIEIKDKTQDDSVKNRLGLPAEMLEKADSHLARFETLLANSYLYDSYNLKYAEKASISTRIERDLSVDRVENGIVLPLRNIDPSSRDGIFEGGVVNASQEFVAGLKRKKEKQTNMSVRQGYNVTPDEIEKIDEDVIYGGVIFPTARRFGHMMIETMSRLWYVVENPDDTRRIAFNILPESDEFSDVFFRLLGIDTSRIMVVKKPTQFRSVTIPEQAFILFSDYHEKAKIVYEKMMSMVEAKPDEKLYLTRRSFLRYDGVTDGINEEYLENFFSKRGYTVLSPEQLSVEDQIAYIKGAKDIVCTEGTLSHLSLFANPGTKVTIIRRSLNSYLLPQYMIDELKELDVSYVDATFNFLPDIHVDSVFLFGPTPCFLKYLDSRGIEYSEEETKISDELIVQYIRRYAENFSDKQRFISISKLDMFDMIQSMNNVLCGRTLSRFDYDTKQHLLELENRELNRRIEKMEKSLQVSEKKREEMLNSKSWKITKPLRKLTNK